MQPENKVQVSIHEVLRAGAVLFGLIAGGGLVAGGFNQLPGIVWPALLALGLSVALLGRRCWRQALQKDELGKLPASFISTALGAVVFAFAMPAIFPNGAYDSARWLVWVDATILGTGLMAVPINRAHLHIAGAMAQRRAAR